VNALNAENPSLSASKIATSETSGMSKSLAQQVNTDQNIENAQPKVTNNLYPLYSIDVRMEVSNFDIVVVEIVAQLLGHALGEGSNEDPFLQGDSFIYL
jgi:hypothetical protein